MRELKAAGKSLIFISHKLDEVLSIADRCVVLRRGRVVGDLPIERASKTSLAELMVGRQVSFERRRQTPAPGPVVLRVEGLEARSERGLPTLRGVGFELRAGEVLGIAGIAGNGQSELVEVLAGLRRPQGGRVLLEGKSLPSDPARLFTLGVAHIPEDRIRMGSVPNMSVAENLALRSFEQPPIAHGFLLNPKALATQAQEQVRAYAIATPSVHTPARLLSGGNLQKVILARELATQARLILAVHPTYGLDIGATEQVHEALLHQTRLGAAVVLVSEDLEELLSLSDRIGVMHRGELLGPYAATEVSREQIGLLMTGGAA